MTPPGGPYVDDLSVGDSFSGPTVTLDAGLQAQHRSILGDRLRLCLDADLAERVTGRRGLVHPAVVWDVAVGQSSVVTRRVVANLFYRDLRFHATPHLGDALSTTTEVLAIRRVRPRQDRPERGKVVLRIRARDQTGRGILDFDRCALLPYRHGGSHPEHTGDDDALFLAPTVPSRATAPAWLEGWSIESLGSHGSDETGSLIPGETIEVGSGDVVSSAPELARLTTNVAAVHHDADVSGGHRLVYGGHVIGLALSQVCRAVPRLVTVTEWFACDHIGPVHEGDTLRSRVTVLGITPYRHGSSVAVLRARAHVAGRGDVLDWTFAGLVV